MAFIPALFALVVVMFSIEGRPAPLVNKIAPEAFDGGEAFGAAQEFTVRYPDRKPGQPGDAQLGDTVRKRLEALGLDVSTDSFSADGRKLTNVTGVLSGPSSRQIVVMAHRDAPRKPGAASAASTAALLEMARALDASSRDKTFVFVSTDGASLDLAGARHFASAYPDRSKVDALFVVDDIAAADANRPYLIPWSDNPGRSSLQLLRTSEAALQREVGAGAGYQSWAGQFMRQAWPITLREQGPLVEDGYNAITITADGEVPRKPNADGLEQLSELRLSQFGRAAMSAALAFDSAPKAKLRSSPERYLVAARKLMPGWAIALLAIALLLPALAASVDAFARARRQGDRIGGWVRWVLSAAVPFAVTLAAAWLFELADWLPASPAEALSPLSRPGFGETTPALIALVLLFALGWIVLRPALLRAGHAPRKPEGSAPAVALALVFSVELLLVWAANPFIALLLVPAAHLALLAALPESPSRPLLIGVTIFGALLLPALALVYYGSQADLGLHLGSYLLMLVTSATTSLPTGVLCALIGGSLVSTVLIALATGGRDREQITVRGPTSYAGPGSLGGTQSAMSPRR